LKSCEETHEGPIASPRVLVTATVVDVVVVVKLVIMDVAVVVVEIELVDCPVAVVVVKV
jgi:hypothetical protein